MFGPTGPSFGAYQVLIDNSPIGVYNASRTVPTFNTLLFYATQLDTSRNHQITLTNQVEGPMLAIDYFVIATSNSQGNQPFWPGGQGAAKGDDSTGALVGGILGGLIAAVSLSHRAVWQLRRLSIHGPATALPRLHVLALSTERRKRQLLDGILRPHQESSQGRDERGKSIQTMADALVPSKICRHRLTLFDACVRFCYMLRLTPRTES